MKGQYYILGDWGTSALRLKLGYWYDDKVEILEKLSGSGVKFCDDLEQSLFYLIRPWTKKYGKLDIILCGMIGSTIGLVSVDYVVCPCNKEDIFNCSYSFQLNKHAITILPGIKCKNLLGLDDIIRGEETQLINLLESVNRKLICLPGTHTKWVIIDQNKINNFFTGMQGELFELLTQHSTLINVEPQLEFNREEFSKAVVNSSPDILHSLFNIRVQQIVNNIDGTISYSRLSGALIGAEIKGGLKIIKENYHTQFDQVILVGVPNISQLFQTAFALQNVKSVVVDGNSAFITGLVEFLKYTKQ